jgi:RNA polymerase-binding transcription factor DksA
MADEADMSQPRIDFELDLAIKNHRHHIHELPQMIDVQTGEVLCWECNAVIPAERLAVVPTATYCVGCLQVIERRHKLEGG